MQRTIIRAGYIALALLAVTSALVLHPDAPTHHATPLFQGAQIDEPTVALLQRSCQNCHSENTRWPWYSRIPPASWLIAKDVDDARRHVNFSRWNSYPAAEQENLLARIGAAARTGQMPPRRYTFLHHEAVLTAAERQQIYEWSRAERKHVRAAGAGVP
jgi:hypothetical protein